MVKLRIHLSPTIEVEAEGETENECIKHAAFWTNLPVECPVCGAPVTLFYRTPQQYEFYGLRCTGPTPHESTFGTHKADGSLFYKEREPWVEARMGRQTEEDGWPAEQGQDEPPYQAPPEPRRGNGTAKGRTATAPLKPVAQQQAAPAATGTVPTCEDCGKGLTLGQINVSHAKFNRPLCPSCQQLQQ